MGIFIKLLEPVASGDTKFIKNNLNIIKMRQNVYLLQDSFGDILGVIVMLQDAVIPADLIDKIKNKRQLISDDTAVYRIINSDSPKSKPDKSKYLIACEKFSNQIGGTPNELGQMTWLSGFISIYDNDTNAQAVISDIKNSISKKDADILVKAGYSNLISFAKTFG